MTVKTILCSKGSDVTTIEPTATLECGIGILAEQGIGALVVLGADHRVIGIPLSRPIHYTLLADGTTIQSLQGSGSTDGGPRVDCFK
jgi:CBS domain-containing protein